MEVSLINLSNSRMPKKFMTLWLCDASKALKKKNIKYDDQLNLSVVFMNRDEAKKINNRYRKKNYPTDVLSFEGDRIETLGELVLSPEVIKKQAKEHGLSFQEELGYMLLHGLLHLIGYDHETNEREALKMFKLQDEIFDKLCRKFWN